MNKKAYIVPETRIVLVTMHCQIMGFSGDSPDGVKTKGTPDNSDEPNRSRGNQFWEDDF